MDGAGVTFYYFSCVLFRMNDIHHRFVMGPVNHHRSTLRPARMSNLIKGFLFSSARDI